VIAYRRLLPLRRSTGAGQTRPSGLDFGQGLAGKKAHGMPKPPRVFARVRGGCSGLRHGMGGSVQRSSPACALTYGSEHQGWVLRPGMRVRCRSKLDWAVSSAIGGLSWQGSCADGGRTPAAVVPTIWAATVYGNWRKRTRRQRRRSPRA
jgi:hypothetical protein